MIHGYNEERFFCVINQMEPEVQVTSTKGNYLFVNVFALTCLFRKIKFQTLPITMIVRYLKQGSREKLFEVYFPLTRSIENNWLSIVNIYSCFGKFCVQIVSPYCIQFSMYFKQIAEQEQMLSIAQKCDQFQKLFENHPITI